MHLLQLMSISHQKWEKSDYVNIYVYVYTITLFFLL